MKRRLFIVTALLTASVAAPVFAQSGPPTRVRGTIASVEGNILKVNSRDGQKLEIVLTDPLTVLTVKKVDLESIGDNAYVGIASRTGPDGKPSAIEVLVFSEAGRGTAEGQFPWDLEAGSMMTNGTVKGTASAASGRQLTLAFKDKSDTILVPKTTPVVTTAPAARDDLKAGAPVFFGATKNGDGKLTAGRIVVGKDGVAPPM